MHRVGHFLRQPLALPAVVYRRMPRTFSSRSMTRPMVASRSIVSPHTAVLTHNGNFRAISAANFSSTPAESGIIFEVNDSNFATHVLQSKVPVILDCYADWCGPCKQLTPLLEKATQAAGGKVHLAKLNIDFNQTISNQLKVESLPTVIGIHQQKMVEKFVGMLSPDKLEAFMQKMLWAADGTAAAAAPSAAGDGDTAKAAVDCTPEEAFDLGFKAYREEQFATATQYFEAVVDCEKRESPEERRERRDVERREARAADAANHAAQQAAARTPPRGGPGGAPSNAPQRRVAPPTLENLASRSMALSALSLLASSELPKAVAVVKDIKANRQADIGLPDVSRAVALVEISDAAPDSEEISALTACVADDPAAHAERLKLAAGLASVGEFEEAIEHGLKVIKADRNWNEGEGKKFLLRIFNILGPQHELSKTGRKRMSNLLF